MNKKIILCMGLIISWGLMKAENNNDPVLIKHFFTDIITFEGSKKTISGFIQSNDPEFEKVALLHELKDGSFEDLGEIGSPKSYSQSVPTSKFVVLAESHTICWCAEERFFLTTQRHDVSDICAKAALWKEMVEKNRKETEDTIFKVSP